MKGIHFVKSANLLTRREALSHGLAFAASAVLASLPLHLLADELAQLDVAYAGSMGSLMEGPLRTSAAQALKLELHGRAQGSTALAQLIAGGSIRPDVFICITPSPMLTVLREKATIAQPIAHTEMVIAYSPKSRFASRFDAAAKGKEDLWKILQEPGLRFGRTDPVTDPQGRNIIFTMLLAATLYKQSGLVEKILGPVINQQQIFTEPTVQARLQSGELDAASAYKTQPGPFNLPYITLPKEVNLGGQNFYANQPEISLKVNGKTYQPEPLIFYAAALNDAPNAKGAAAFVDWLRRAEAQAIFSRFNYDPPGDASPLRA
jgi:molybdate/tungstate transport system substrate-binding protein